MRWFGTQITKRWPNQDGENTQYKYFVVSQCDGIIVTVVRVIRRFAHSPQTVVSIH